VALLLHSSIMSRLRARREEVIKEGLGSAEGVVGVCLCVCCVCVFLRVCVRVFVVLGSCTTETKVREQRSCPVCTKVKRRRGKTAREGGGGQHLVWTEHLDSRLVHQHLERIGF